MPSGKKSGGSRKIGTHLRHCAAYRASGHRYANKERRCRKSNGKPYAVVWAESRIANGLPAPSGGHVR